MSVGACRGWIGSWILILIRIWTLAFLGSVVVVVIAISPIGWAGQGQVQTPSVTLNASGSLGVGIRVGLGDPKGLLQKGYSNQWEFQQFLTLSVEGAVPVTWPLEGTFSIAAQLDNQKADNLQSLTMHFDSEHWLGDFGDFVVGEDAPQFIVPDRKLKGFKVQGLWEDLSFTGAFARVEGIAESKTFRGNTSAEVVTFSRFRADRPWLEQPYLRNLRGLEFYPLRAEFVEGFTQVKLDLHADEELEALLAAYGLDYLAEGIAEEGPTELEEAQFEVIRKEGQTYLILKREALELLRDRIRDGIDDYNRKQDLEAEERKEYPFNEGTDYELGFLRRLQDRATLDVDGEALPLGSYRRQRFYFLGHRDVDADTLKLEVATDGQFTDVTDPELVGYTFDLFAEPGLVDLDFPQEFFDNPDSRMRASYNYTSTTGLYVLGLSIVKGSDRVFLNGKPLQRDVDYTIDYETGALILFKQVGKEDVLRIEYEILRGGLGGFTEYKRNLSQLSLAYRPTPWLTVHLDAFQGADTGGPVEGEGEDRSRVRTMPNTHTVIGFRGQADLGDLKASLVLGYNVNTFPFDDNLRVNEPNRVNVIEALDQGGRTFVLFGHQNGLSVYDGLSWTLYGAASLSGRSVTDIAVSEEAGWVALATESGVTLVRLEGEDPFARADNWRRFYKQDGLAHNKTWAVGIQGDTLWIGTADGLSRVRFKDLEEPERWRSYRREEYPEMPTEAVTQVAPTGTGALVYLGTEEGLVLFDPLTETFQVAESTRGLRVRDLALDGETETVYVATDWGIRAFFRGRGSGWLLVGRQVSAVAVRGNEVWYGTASGLYRLPEELLPELQGQPVSALAWVGEGVRPYRRGSLLGARTPSPKGAVLWVGTEAIVSQAQDQDQDEGARRYTLKVWEVGTQTSEVKAYESRETRIDGRDEHRFHDPAAWEHTALGGLGQLALNYTLGDLKLTGAIEGLSPGFTAVGGQDRKDYLRWRLGAKYALSPALSLSAEHVSGLVNPSRGRGGSFSVKDNLGVDWEWGPKVSLTYTRERLDNRARTPGFDQIKTAVDLSARQGFFEDRLTVEAAVSAQAVGYAASARRSQELDLSGSVRYRVFDDLTLSWTFSSPLRVSSLGRGRRSLYGSAQMGWQVDWSPPLGLGALDLSWTREDVVRFPGGLATEDDRAQASLTWQSVEWMGVQLTPRGRLSLQRSLSRGTQVSQLSGEGSVRGLWGALSGQLRWSRDLNQDARSRRSQVRDRLSLNLDYGGFQDLRPGLDWSLTVEHLSHPFLGRKRRAEQQFSARLDWSPLPELDAGLSLSRRAVRAEAEEEDSVSYTLRGDAVYRFQPALSVSLTASGGYTVGKQRREDVDRLDFDLELQGSWRLSPEWSATFLVGALWGQDRIDPDNSYLSFIASTQATMLF